MMSFQSPILVCLTLGLFLLVACEQESLELEQVTTAPELVLNYTDSPIDDALTMESRRRRYRYAENVMYGNHRRNAFDIFTLDDDEPTPLVIYIHAGGFTGGDKRQAYEFSDAIRQFIVKGIAFATINYRLLDDSDNGVMTSLEDTKRCLQYIRYHADDLNIDKERIAVFGTSAGAGSSLWLGTHDDMANPNSNDPIDRESSRVIAAAALGTQATYDLVRWEEIFAEFGFQLDSPVNDQQALFDFYGINSYEMLYQEDMEQYRAKVDMLSMFTSDDPPVYVFNTGSARPPANDGELFHHPYHAIAVGEAAQKAGIENSIYAPGMGISDSKGEDPAAFLIRHLK